MSRDSHPVSRRRRRITRILAASCLILGLGSCTAVLDLEKYGNAAQQMCSLIDRCYGKTGNDGCQGILETYLHDVDPPTREEWLASFNNYNCLASCSAGRSCLNIPPLCVAVGASCKRTLDCCGSLEGHADCDTKTKACCKARGASCSANEPCCDGAGACDQDLCGGLACTEANEDCSQDTDCCSRICQNNRCSASICRQDTFNCTADKECCSGFCDPARQACAIPPVCAQADQGCSLPTDCCDDLACVVAPGRAQGTCQTSTCVALTLECATNEQCCSGRCDPTSFFCASSCSPGGGTCAADAECCDGSCTNHVCAGACSTSVCKANADCCSQHCFDGFCSAECAGFDSHPGCSSGGPLDSANDSCVAAVCETDPFCCCNAWDDYCVEAFYGKDSKCAETCP